MRTTFFGFERANGSVGVRNHVAVISAMDNSNFVARRVCQQVRGTVPVCPCFGRGEVGDDLEQHIAILGGVGANPNVYSAVIVSLEPVIAGRIAEIIRREGKEAVVLSFDECGGTVGTTAEAVRTAERMVIAASKQKRVEAPVSKLLLGTECGGSDTISGLISNPATGMVADKLIDLGGSAVLSETTEWMGAEEQLRARAVTPELGQRIVDAIKWYEDYIISIGVDINGTNPAPDNIKGGLSTIEEKALGAVEKGGSRPIQDLITYGQRPTKQGLTLVDASPGGVENTTTLAAAGCQLIIFSTGKGNPIGNPVVPTIKVTGNDRTIVNYADNIDVDLTRAVTEDIALEDVAAGLFEDMLDYADGKLTTAEVLGDTEIAVTRIGYTV
ncbi:MAG: UxaA family hydrolase [Oscillospiraceae bacterium]